MKLDQIASRAVPSQQLHALRSGEHGVSAPPAASQPPSIGPFFTVQQIAERHPAFTVRTLRHWIFNATNRRAWKDRRAVVVPGNGFDRVIVRKGRRIFINEAALFAWLDRGPTPAETPER
jgi:hypothetical protein